MSDSPKSAFTIDLSGAETPARTAGRVLLGGLLLVVGGLLAVGFGVLSVVGDFIPPVSDLWAGWFVVLAPFIGVLFFAVALVGLVMLLRGRKAARSIEVVADVLEATGLAEVETDAVTPATENPRRIPPPSA